MTNQTPQGVSIYTVSEALKAGFTTAYKGSSSKPLTALDPDNCAGFLLYEKAYHKDSFTKEDLLPEVSALGLNAKEDYLRSLPDAIWDKILKPLNNYCKEKPLVYKNAVGILINRRI